MKKLVILSILPLVAACGSSNSSGSASPSSAGFTRAATATGTVVTKDPAFDNPRATYLAGTTDRSSNQILVGLEDGVDIIDTNGATQFSSTRIVNQGNAQTAAAGYSVTRDLVRAGPQGFAETYRLYDPNDNLIAIETASSGASTTSVVGSVGYFGQWNGEVDGNAYEQGAVNVVVNSQTGQADLVAYYPDQNARLIDEQAGANTLTYNAATQQVTGAVTFNTTGANATSATGETVMHLSGPGASFNNGVNAAPQLLSGVAHTDGGQPFEANIGFVAGLNTN
ncbi:hypothetical protein [Shimia marina]|uniref:Transferrin binding protein-like solute binding protein n=1 Tax=Shimia marina TaxID=321267 RepID=A0A0P1ESU4_9RHOB|nr:hypothetical protein [Shimia marina]CUH53065.1 hypothetical protein SHM7688_02517 [Shimia marina]SFD93551.1 hypothetical protein SAMN04488037_103316 [Shimia marina]